MGNYLEAELISARLYKAEKKLVTEYEMHRPLSASEVDELREHTLKLVGEDVGVKLEMSFRSFNIRDAFSAGQSDVMNVVLKSAFHIMPVAKPMLENADVLAEDGAIVMRVDARHVKLLEKMELARRLMQFMQETYGDALDVRIVAREGEESSSTPEPVRESTVDWEKFAVYRTPEEVKKAAAEAKPKKSDAPKWKKKDDNDNLPGRHFVPGEGNLKLYGNIGSKSYNIIDMKDVTEFSGTVTVCGCIFNELGDDDVKKVRGDKTIAVIKITDKTNSLFVKLFLKKGEDEVIDGLRDAKKRGDWIIVRGRYSHDEFAGMYCIFPDLILTDKPKRRRDTSAEKRVELHLHTQMSAMDALVNVNDAVNTAASWGHRAVAITDHGVVQAFPNAISAAEKLQKSGKDIKIILGVEGYLLPDSELVPFEGDFCAVSVTSSSEGKHEAFFELSAVKFDANGEKDRFYRLVDPGIALPREVMEATGITEAEISAAESFGDVLPEFSRFIGGAVIVTHEPQKLLELHKRAKALNCEISSHCVSTEMLFHYLFRKATETDLKTAMAQFEITVPTMRAEHTAEAVRLVFASLYEESKKRGAHRLAVIDTVPKEKVKGQRSNFHIILIAKNHEGLLNLYRLVSYSHLEHLKGVPRIPRSLLNIHRDGLIVGSACESGELFRAVLEDRPHEELLRVAAEYDYMEIQPIGNNEFLVRNDVVKDDAGLRELNRRILEIGDELGKMTVATGDVHFLDPEDSIYRAVLMSARDFKDAEQQAPLYFKTTNEMLEEFSYLGTDRAREVVITNPNAIADMCEKQKAFLSEKSTYAPTFPGANDELRGMAEKRAHEIYGEILPPVVQARLDRELNSIIGNGYASLYLMAQRLVRKSNSDGYLVGSRGSVGSSFVATMAGITEVNPLQPHYICDKCKYSDFDIDRKKYACGVDLPDRDCPVCGTKLSKLGYEIPFEVFLGFKGDKTPDIDLNFSGENQSAAHKYTEVMFGVGHAFRAGTISGLKDKTVYGYVKKYMEQNGVFFSRAEIDRIIAGCCGVKRTTGQHPGGIVIVPEENDIMEFTPIQHPADKDDAGTITTHFDFHAMDDRLVKLDILGHDDPTVLKMLKDITGLDPTTIPLDDKETMLIYSSISPLKITLEELDCDVGSLAIPEFGTDFVRHLLMDTRPTTMEELVRISGLSHGTNVWVGNAQDLVKAGIATLSGVICTRDDIMNYLILRGGEASLSFKTMESVRKGRGVKPEMEEAMRAIDTPEWFIDSCKKIKYLFPRAHAAAYVMMSFRVAFYKVHHPLAFYCVYYTVRADAFDIAQASGGKDRVLRNIQRLRAKGNDIETKEADLLTILEVVFEMNKRGIELLPVDLYKSEATRFLVEGNAIRPPFSSIAGVGGNAAQGLADGRGTGDGKPCRPYLSVEDFRRRTKANSGVINVLREMGCFHDLPEEDQTRLF